MAECNGRRPTRPEKQKKKMAVIRRVPLAQVDGRRLRKRGLKAHHRDA